MEINTFTLTSVLRELDPTTSAEEAIRRIKTIDLGLSAEDEFQAIITWLGRCKVSHKIENIEFHSRGFVKINIPDIIAAFEYKGIKIITSIEVKSNKEKKLDWTNSYYNDFLAYQQAFGVPVLVAWKHTDLGIWTLNALSSFTKALTNYHLSMEDAFKDNLLSCLAGDKAYQLGEGVGLHVEGKKLSLVNKNIVLAEEEWKIQITNAWFTDSTSNKYGELPNGVWPLFLASSISSISSIEDSIIKQDFVFHAENENGISLQYLHMALPLIIKFTDSDDSISWREMLRNDTLPISGNELRIGQALFCKFTIGSVQPVDTVCR